MGPLFGGPSDALAVSLAAGIANRCGDDMVVRVQIDIRVVEFSRRDLHEQLEEFARNHDASRVSSASLKRDIDCFALTYSRSRRRQARDEEALDCPLVELGLLRESEVRDRYYLARENHRSLPSGVFVFGLASFLKTHQHQRPTTTVEELASAPSSPGRVFCLNENRVDWSA